MAVLKAHDKRTVGKSPYHRVQSPLGFTLLELLTVIAVIGVLAAMLLPVFGKSKIRAQGIQCLGNLRQLSLGWQLYADDAKGVFPVNGSTVAGRQAETGTLGNPSWVAGVLELVASPDNTNALKLVGPAYAPFGSIGEYIKNPGVYHCPGDRSVDPACHLPRVRSVSMNSWLNPGRTNTAASYWTMKFQKFTQGGDFRKVSPTDIFTFLDESAQSINDGWLRLSMAGYESDGSIDRSEVNLGDIPASYHNNTGSFSFADGHAEPHRWLGGAALDDDDVIWLMTHASVPE